MRKYVLTLMLLNMIAVGLFSQAKQPNLMVIPSDLYCNKHYYTMSFDNQGMTETLPDYQKALSSDENLKQVISKINEMIIDRGYTRDKIKSLENTLKKLKTDQAIINAASSKSSGALVSETPLDQVKRSAKPDIILDIYFDVKRQGPRQYISFNLQGIDAYNSSVIASVSGDGTPALNSSITTGALIEEAILSHLDNFLDQVQSYFEEMFEMGRTAKFHIHVWDSSPVDLEEYYDYNGEELELNEILDDWFADNAVAGRYDIEDGSETFMTVSARIPLFDDRNRAMDANRYARQITKFLKMAPFNLEIKRVPQGLGETWLFIGEK
jgi:hypothetical protein